MRHRLSRFLECEEVNERRWARSSRIEGAIGEQQRAPAQVSGQSNLRFVATCVPGAEPWLQRELAERGVVTDAVVGGVEGRAPLPTIRFLLERARLPESVRVRATRPFMAHTFEQLEVGLARVPWHAYLVRRLPLDVRVSCKHSRLFHSDAVAQRVRTAVSVRVGEDASRTPDDVSVRTHCNRVYLRLVRDQVQVSFDAGGEALHRRGYRRHVVDAPLRETLAALLLRIAEQAARGGGFQRLWDPCAGSGTIPLEWLAARWAVPNTRSNYLMDEWPCFGGARDVEGSVLGTGAVSGKEAAVAFPAAVAISDVSEAAVMAARANARALGVESRCSFTVADFEAVEASIDDGTAVVTNLPYGVRLGSRSHAVALLQRLTAMLHRRSQLRPAVVLTGAGPLQRELSQKWTRALSFRNGGTPVTAWVMRD